MAGWLGGPGLAGWLAGVGCFGSRSHPRLLLFHNTGIQPLPVPWSPGAFLLTRREERSFLLRSIGTRATLPLARSRSRSRRVQHTRVLCACFAPCPPAIDPTMSAWWLTVDRCARVQVFTSCVQPGPVPGLDKAQLVADVRAALYASKVCSYAQGMNIIKAKSIEKNWNINLGGLGRIWKVGGWVGGCG